LKRQKTLEAYAARTNLKVIIPEEYDLDGFIQNVVFRETDRCRFCYHDRIKSTALLAKRGKFDYFTTTLLYSKHQNHELIQSMGHAIGKSVGVPFFYQDFRIGWQEGITESKHLGMYRQQYCGCIYSEKERYYQRSPLGENDPQIN
jgi:predicted adenine nucleotide alpha hydrolase (AANH) superfamily ATPase